MEKHLEWEPATPRPAIPYLGTRKLPNSLRVALVGWYGSGFDRVLCWGDSEADLAYLHGLSYARVDGASELLDLVEEHRLVRIRETR